MDVVSLASEFPNDNPALHRGVCWLCLDPTGPAVAVWEVVDRAFEVVDGVDDEEPEEVLVEELEPVEAMLEGEPVEPVFEAVPEPPRESSVLPTAPDDPFTTLVCLMADLAIGAGSPYAASILPGLLLDGRVPPDLEDGVAQALRDGGILEGSEVAPGFAGCAAAWRSILRGTSEDFSACGSSMLDEWAADVVARVLATAGRAPTLRQELRTRGVAAFGLVDAAA